MPSRDPELAELDESRRLVEQLATLAGAGTFRLRGTPAVVDAWSPRMARLHGLVPGIAACPLAEYVRRFVHEDDRAAVRRHLVRATAHTDADLELEYSIVRVDGEHRRLRAVLRALQSGSGEHAVVGVVQDVTEGDVPYRDPLATAGRLATLTRLAVVGEMATGFAHQLNQPLTALANYASAAARLAGPTADARLRSALSGVVASAERAADVARRMRALARMPLGDVVPTDLNALLRETVPLLEPLSHHHSVPLRIDAAARLPVVQVDPAAIQLAIINLACNAIEASAAARVPGLVVELATSATSEGVELAVRDHGVGLPQATAEQLFMPFYSTKPEAAGLGLAIAEAIARQHAGRVTLGANAEGGVTARLSVPAKPLRHQRESGE